MANGLLHSSARLVAVDSWVLDSAGFERLLRFLDPDRERAARRYEDIRRRLLKLFEWRGCLAPDECVDRTMDRVARRLAEGAAIHVTDPYQYFHGVAVNVLREHWRTPGRRYEELSAAAESVMPAPEPRDEEAAAFERTLTCLEACLARLPAQTRALLLAYHAEPDRIARRQQLAASLGIALNALRIRVHRIRATVETCVLACAGGGSAEMDAARPHHPTGGFCRHERRSRRSTGAVPPGAAGGPGA
jgi:DNA-directed RNA polymerase specialized sigma24 family protein